jgi:hypothetical protein
MSNAERSVQNVEVGNHGIELQTLSAKVLILDTNYLILP